LASWVGFSFFVPTLFLTLFQVREILSSLREGRQTLMFSATLPRSLADFAAAGLSTPQLVRLDADRRLSPDLALSFFTGGGRGVWVQK